jgi:transcriptional regulator with XRE-family HTH domain
MLIRNKLRARIIQEGYTQRSFAAALGVSENTLSSRIRGRSYFNTSEIEVVCSLLKIVSNSEKADIFLNQSSHMWDETVAIASDEV